MAKQKRTNKQVSINRIKAVLADCNKTSEDLRAHFGVAQSTVSNWVTNKIQPDVYTFLEIARFLDVDIRDLFVSTK
ncbi:helix-turn-helix transcriptional regulator [Paraflavitalea sp. CAU 1676]|uniref:helix-turn-helix transcriptional regulator n=1 Tax=Paraflavitalea sp. CAU 1676 TaxID=3032598 RepID=UPI0023DA78EA|nr:helix-turn-helix transcriptional regulator [Paraflavitalea sp. CAU 1676]MDF2189825.1 helix-turn-helix transcriptional regulator [Paraflavitalea sp. CAU 1676]